MGEAKVWRVVHVPGVEAEDARHLHRELAALTAERTRMRNRIRSLLATQGQAVGRWKELREELETKRLWDGRRLGAQLRVRLERELARLEVVEDQIREIRREMKAELAREAESGSALDMMQRLAELRSIGPQGARVLAMELFGWREFKNRRQVGGVVGLTPTPYQSGETCTEQGIGKSGNVWVRRVMIQVAWAWLRWQPDSELTRWFNQRFAQGGRRQRQVGIVAVARKLVIVLWHYVERGEVPAGAVPGKGAKYVLKAA
jgi:transposase